jgi:hypothetical protein
VGWLGGEPVKEQASMALMLSEELMRNMGFQPISAGEPIEAIFHCLHVYAVKGLTIQEGTVFTARDSVSGAPFAFAVGSGVNALCRSLLNDDLADDEAEWAKEHSVGPPYAIVHIGPTATHSAKSGHVKAEGASLTTYDAFSSAKDELALLESQVLPSVITALHCAFSSEEHRVQFKHVVREVFGFTPTHSLVHDIRMLLNATVEVSQSLADEDLRNTVARAANLAASVNPKVSRFFRLASEEQDRLKRFLYFFLSIEIETHQAFRTIDRTAQVARVFNSEDRLRSTSSTFFEAQHERWTSLADRFVWCAICVWSRIDEADVTEFRRLKKIRDEIAHGSLAEPLEESVRAVQRLAMKLQWHAPGAGVRPADGNSEPPT